MSTSKFAADERSQGLDQSRRDFLVDGWMVFFWVDSKVGTFLLKGNLLYVYKYIYILSSNKIDTSWTLGPGSFGEAGPKLGN